ncbi:hypothetical protein [Candidatus Oscillochloris fontis]|uniref:hypothetical protein n=1 Tax=Candidatus Oscillochloris fontis TaxID=2496868 RepID=UPI00101E0C51|nr:hypothetical protein [Candidatus Oscillochloris fontis]
MVCRRIWDALTPRKGHPTHPAPPDPCIHKDHPIHLGDHRGEFRRQLVNRQQRGTRQTPSGERGDHMVARRVIAQQGVAIPNH